MTKQHIAFEVAIDEHYKTPYLQGLKENWPSLAKDYRHFCHTNKPELGAVWLWTSPEGQKFFHLVLEEKSGDKQSKEAKLHAFRKALKTVKKLATEEKLEVLDLPKSAFHFNKEELTEAEGILTEAFSDGPAKVHFS